MSLRLRLLVAVGLIAVVALVVADFATYSALRNSLYNQVDQELAAHRPGVPVDITTGALTCQSPRNGQVGPNPFVGNSGPGGPGGPGGGADTDGGNGGPNVSGIYYSVLVNPSGSVLDGLECPAYIGSHAYKPQIPSQIGGFTAEPDGTKVAYFTTGSSTPGGPNFSTSGPSWSPAAITSSPSTRSP